MQYPKLIPTAFTNFIVGCRIIGPVFWLYSDTEFTLWPKTMVNVIPSDRVACGHVVIVVVAAISNRKLKDEGSRRRRQASLCTLWWSRSTVHFIKTINNPNL